MLIECPACQARATVPDSKRGAKVRCPGCSRVYQAQPRSRTGSGGSRARGRAADPGANRSRWILGGIGGVGLVGILILGSRGDDEPAVTQAAAPAPPPQVVVDDVPSDWDLEAVQAAVRIHEAAAQGRASDVAALLHAPAALAFLELAEELESSEAALELDVLASQRASDLAALAADELAARTRELAQRIVDGEFLDGNLVSGWRPYDREGLQISDDAVSFRLAVTSRDPDRAGEKRSVEWRMAKVDGEWRAWAWFRYIGEKERKGRLRHGTEKVTLSDGIEVTEREPEPLGHLETTPQELRDVIDALVDTMTDLDLTREAAAAKRRLVDIGRPAIPILLTQLFENPLENQDQAIQGNMVVETLREITGQRFGYRPAVGDGAMSTTDERRNSSIRQWFAWWYRNELTFEEKKQGKDELEKLITEEDKRLLERRRNK